MHGMGFVCQGGPGYVAFVVIVAIAGLLLIGYLITQRDL